MTAVFENNDTAGERLLREIAELNATIEANAAIIKTNQELIEEYMKALSDSRQ